MRIKGKKATVGITLPPEMVKKAREYGLNISKICENALKVYIERLEGRKTETNGGYGAGGGIRSRDLQVSPLEKAHAPCLQIMSLAP